MADPVTPNLGLTLPAAHETEWNTPTNNNWTIVDTFAATVVLYNPTTGQTVTQPASTYLAVNGLQVFGALPVLPFGVAAGAFGAALSMPSAGVLSADHTEPGDAGATFKANILNALTGLQVDGAAPNGYLLIGNGSEYVPSATLPSGLVNYQTVEQAGTPLTQRGKLNFLAPLTAVDDSGNASSDVGLAASGVTAGSYVAANVTVDTYGRVTAASNSTLSRTVNSNGYYISFPDGTLLQGGTINVPSTGTDYNTATVAYPTPFITAASPVITSIGLPSTTGDPTTPMAAEIQSATLAGFTAYMARVIIAGAGGSQFDQAFTLSWMAFGY